MTKLLMLLTLLPNLAFGYGIVSVSAGSTDNQVSFVRAEVRTLDTILRSNLSLGLSYDKFVSKAENNSNFSAGLYFPLADSRRVLFGAGGGQMSSKLNGVSNYGEFTVKVRLWP